MIEPILMVTTPTPPTVVAAIAPAPLPVYSYLALDIETSDGRPEDAERDLRLTWKPDPRWTDETIGKRYKEALAKKLEKLALLDSAPIVCVSLRSESELRCLHALQAEPAHLVEGGLVEGFATQREMLIALRALLDARCSDETLLVGHNIVGFDLRKLRWAYVKAELAMPYVLRTREQPVFDTMLRYGQLFAVGSKDLFIALAELLELFGLPSHKGEIDGSMVPQLVREGRFDELVRYALKDAAAEHGLFLRMSGQLEDQAEGAA
jgi:hypothetical protein